jgi:hypothetical protein
MTRFMLLYVGPATPPDASHAGWPEWFASLGDRLVDRGSPLADGHAVHADGTTAESATQLNGYSIVEAEDVAGVRKLIKEHPYLLAGGGRRIELYSLP